MKTLVLLLCLCAVAPLAMAQADADREAVTLACKNYIEGFYEGDTAKIISALRPSLHKFGYWKDKETGLYAPEGHMSFQQAKDYAADVLKSKHFAPKAAPRGIEVYDVSEHTACAKITAWWGIDYVLLSKHEGSWKIEQVLWEGPLKRERK